MAYVRKGVLDLAEDHPHHVVQLRGLHHDREHAIVEGELDPTARDLTCYRPVVEEVEQTEPGLHRVAGRRAQLGSELLGVLGRPVVHLVGQRSGVLDRVVREEQAAALRVVRLPALAVRHVGEREVDDQFLLLAAPRTSH